MAFGSPRRSPRAPFEAPERYSVSPLPSFCTVSAMRSPPLSASVRDLIFWLVPRLRPRFNARLASLEDALLDQLAEDDEPGRETKPGPVP
jgi:hypothetical protein